MQSNKDLERYLRTAHPVEIQTNVVLRGVEELINIYSSWLSAPEEFKASEKDKEVIKGWIDHWMKVKSVIEER